MRRRLTLRRTPARVAGLLVAVCVTSAPQAAHAAARAGYLDRRFSGDGITSVHLSHSSEQAQFVASDAAGGVVVMSQLHDQDAPPESADTIGLARFDSAGTLDTSFGRRGIVRIDLPGGNDEGFALLARPSGGWLVLDGSASSSIVALDETGHLDPSFGAGGIVSTPDRDGLVAIATYADGRVVALGRAVSSGDTIVERFLADGAPDPSFGDDGRQQLADGVGVPVAVALAGSRIVIAGNVGSGPDRWRLGRLRSDGKVDSSFGAGGFTAPGHSGYVVAAIAIAPDGTIVVAGESLKSSQHAVVGFYTRAGLPVSSVGGGTGAVVVAGLPFLDGVAVDGSSRVLAMPGPVRLTMAGALDPTFGMDGIAQVGRRVHDGPGLALGDHDRIYAAATWKGSAILAVGDS